MSQIRRRDLLRGVAAASVATTLGAGCSEPGNPAQNTANTDKRRPQYQPNSADVQTFYTVNRYPAK
jgi:anaerobic selenocysteine-containing dehydrogenase